MASEEDRFNRRTDVVYISLPGTCTKEIRTKQGHTPKLLLAGLQIIFTLYLS
jgi:hypothetical protein